MDSGDLRLVFLAEIKFGATTKMRWTPENSAIADEQADAAGIKGSARLVWITRRRPH
jgi:hypothetical protein